MPRAHYSPQCTGHFALGSDHYTHFTSPIRRYPDLIVHRRLKELLCGHLRALSPAELEAAAEHTSETERRAERSERELLQWKKVRFLADRIGETFSGHITGVQPFGMFVQITDYYVDGLIPIRSLTDDYYVFEARDHALRGERSGRRFRIADPVEVVLTGVSERHRRLDLALADMPEPNRGDRGPNSKGRRQGAKTGPRRRRRRW